MAISHALAADRANSAFSVGANQRTRLRRELFRRRRHPEPALRVEQDSHRSKSASTSSGSASLKPSGTVTRPASSPRRRSPGALRGTSRATGFPALAMMISSPALTRSRSRERWVSLRARSQCLSFSHRHFKLSLLTRSIVFFSDDLTSPITRRAAGSRWVYAWESAMADLRSRSLCARPHSAGSAEFASRATRSIPAGQRQ